MLKFGIRESQIVSQGWPGPDIDIEYCVAGCFGYMFSLLWSITTSSWDQYSNKLNDGMGITHGCVGQHVWWKSIWDSKVLSTIFPRHCA